MKLNSAVIVVIIFLVAAVAIFWKQYRQLDERTKALALNFAKNQVAPATTIIGGFACGVPGA